MQLDKTRIAIRERGFLDILDLALQVIRGHAGPLLVTSALGVLPFALWNYWLLRDLAAQEVGAGELPAMYLFVLAFWIVLEMPWAGSLSTLYLGQALFVPRPDRWKIARDWFGSLPQMFLFQGVLRAICVPLVLPWFLLFTIWPYLSEIILLERNPLRRRQWGPTTFARSWSLHSRNNGELFARWLGSLVVGPMLVGSLWISFYVLRGMLMNYWELDAALYTVHLQIALWIVLSFFTVVRFLSYLDLRIRNEGWEIELKMRAEAARLTRQFA